MNTKELLSELFVNCTEQIEPVEAKIVAGCIPEWFRGDFIRVCSGKYDLNNSFSVNHSFDGFAMVYKFTFGNEKIHFMKRFLETDAYKKAMRVGKTLYTEFGTKAHADPDKNFLSRVMATFDMSRVTDNSSVNLFQMRGELFASSDTCYFRRLDKETLKTEEKVDLYKMCGVNLACCHVRADGTGKYYTIGSSLAKGTKYFVMETSPLDEHKGHAMWLDTKHIATIPGSWKTSCSYLHSFAMTETYIVFLEQPFLGNTIKIGLAHVQGRSFSECMKWFPEEQVKFIVVNRITGEVVKTPYYCKEAFFSFHFINAYEENKTLIVDIATFKDPEVIDAHFLKKLRENICTKCPNQMMRFAVPIIEDIGSTKKNEELVNITNCTASAKRVNESPKGDHIRLSGQIIGKASFDSNTINNNHLGKKYRYVYGCGELLAPESSQNAVMKVDIVTEEDIMWRGNEYQHPAEPVFVSRPGAVEEDDGVVLVAVTETRKDNPHFLVILDAKTFKEICKIETPVPIPYGHHGIFIPSTP